MINLPNYEEYAIEPDGKVWSFKSGRYLKWTGLSQMRPKVSLCIAGEVTEFLVHRLVALVYIGNPPFELAEVNHKDGDKLNNHFINLEYTSGLGNMAHAKEFGLLGNIVPIIVFIAGTSEVVGSYDSITEACEVLDLDQPSVSSHLNKGRPKTVKGYEMEKL